jgi:hypothetical protein
MFGALDVIVTEGIKNGAARPRSDPLNGGSATKKEVAEGMGLTSNLLCHLSQ